MAPAGAFGPSAAAASRRASSSSCDPPGRGVPPIGVQAGAGGSPRCLPAPRAAASPAPTTAARPHRKILGPRDERSSPATAPGAGCGAVGRSASSCAPVTAGDREAPAARPSCRSRSAGAGAVVASAGASSSTCFRGSETAISREGVDATTPDSTGSGGADPGPSTTPGSWAPLPAAGAVSEPAVSANGGDVSAGGSGAVAGVDAGAAGGSTESDAPPATTVAGTGAGAVSAIPGEPA